MWSLQHRNDPEATLFQKIAEQGHYAGRTTPSDTRQGTYATAPSGVLLASINSNDPKAMTQMLQRALAKWKALPDDQRWLEGDVAPDAPKGRPERFYPSDGLVLRETVRDLPREFASDDWRTQAWNKDYVWFKKAEARSMLPDSIESGREASVPRALLVRIGRFNLVDTVRGQSFNFPESALKSAELKTTVTKVEKGVATVRLAGVMKAEQVGKWPIAGYRDMNDPSDQKRGYDLRLSGEAIWDLVKERFTKFELVAAGTRWGATQYNGRFDDPGPAPIGYLFQLASDAPHDKVPPSEFGNYGWSNARG